MKNLLVSGVVIALVLLLVACGAPGPTPTTPKTSAPAPAPAPSPAPASSPTPKATTPSPAAAPAEVIKMKVSGYGGAGYAPRVGLEKFMELVKERSGGRVQFEYFPNGSLYGLEDAGRAITKNVIQMGATNTTGFGDIIRERAWAQGTPMAIDWRKFDKNYRKSWLPWVEEVTGPKLNWKILWSPLHGTINLVARVPIRAPEDIKGKLIRGGGSTDLMLKLLGSQSINLTGTEVFEALQKGTVDGATGSIDGAITQKWHEVARYIVYFDLYNASQLVAMPLDYYNKLPSDLRQIIDQTSLEIDSVIVNAVEGNLTKEMDTLKKAPKVEVIVFTTEQRLQLQKTIAPWHEEVRKQFGFGKAWDDYLEIIKRDGMGIGS